MMAPKAGGDFNKVNSAIYKDKTKPTDIRLSNINAAKGKYSNLHLLFNCSIAMVLQFLNNIPPLYL